MAKMDLEIKISVPQDKIEKIRHKAEVELDKYKKLHSDKLRDSHIKFLINKVLSEIHGTIAVEVIGTYDDNPYSERAKTNMTAQMLAQWQFLEENKHAKKSELNRIITLYRNAGLPNFDEEEAKRVAGIDVVEKQIEEKKEYIRELQKEGRIHKIIWD